MIAEHGTLLEAWVEGSDVLPAWKIVEDSFIDEKPLMGGWIESVYDAWAEGSMIDRNGNVWLDSENLSKAIRVGSLVDLARFCPGMYHSFNIGDRTYLRGTRVAKVINSVIAKIDRDRGERQQKIAINAEISKELYLIIRNSDPARVRQKRLYDSLEKRREDLREKRTRKMRVTHDELTGEGLGSPEFVYIRNPALYNELLGNIANGLVVNRSTVNVIRAAHSMDERELFQLGKRRGWETGWYKGYRDSLKKEIER